MIEKERKLTSSCPPFNLLRLKLRKRKFKMPEKQIMHITKMNTYSLHNSKASSSLTSLTSSTSSNNGIHGGRTLCHRYRIIFSLEVCSVESDGRACQRIALIALWCLCFLQQRLYRRQGHVCSPWCFSGTKKRKRKKKNPKRELQHSCSCQKETACLAIHSQQRWCVNYSGCR